MFMHQINGAIRLLNTEADGTLRLARRGGERKVSIRILYALKVPQRAGNISVAASEGVGVQRRICGLFELRCGGRTRSSCLPC